MKKFIFGMQIKVKVFYTLITSTHNKKYAYLCDISTKKGGDKVDFLPVDNHGRFLT